MHTQRVPELTIFRTSSCRVVLTVRWGEGRKSAAARRRQKNRCRAGCNVQNIKRPSDWSGSPFRQFSQKTDRPPHHRFVVRSTAARPGRPLRLSSVASLMYFCTNAGRPRRPTDSRSDDGCLDDRLKYGVDGYADNNRRRAQEMGVVSQAKIVAVIFQDKFSTDGQLH